MKRAKYLKKRAKEIALSLNLSQTAARFVDEHPGDIAPIVAKALEAAAREARSKSKRKGAVSIALRKVIKTRRSEPGKLLSISEAAEQLQVTRVTIYAWIKAKRLLAWRATRRGVLIPVEQIIGAGEVVRGIPEILALIPDPEAAWDFLDEESAFIDPDRSVRPIDALRDGKIDAVIAAAHSFLEAFS